MRRLQIKSNKLDQRGFSMFLAVIVTGALLIIAFSVSNIGTKETTFSNITRESQYAIFAADAGIECALYWDSKFGSFSTTTSGSPITCNGSSISTSGAINGTGTPALIGGGGNAVPTSIFGFLLDSATNPTTACTVVSVTKNSNGTTHIKSYGYNTCNTTDPRRVERGIEVRY